MKKIHIITFSILLLAIITLSVLLYTKNEELSREKMMKKSEEAVNMASTLTLTLLQVRHDFLLDAIKKEKENPQYLQTLKESKNFKLAEEVPMDFDIKSFSSSNSPPSASCVISFNDFLGYDKDEIKSQIEKCFKSCSLLLYNISISEEGNTKVFNIKITNNPNWKEDIKNLRKKSQPKEATDSGTPSQ